MDEKRIVIGGEDITDRVEQRAIEGAIAGSAWIPHARARIREGIILKLRLEGKTFTEIAAHPDVKLTVGGVFAAITRLANRTLDPGDVRLYIARQLEGVAVRREIALRIATDDPARKAASNFEKLNALDRWNSADEREAKLLGLDAPKSIHLSGIPGASGGLPPPGGAIDIEMIKKVQELDPILSPIDNADEELCAPVEGADPDDEQAQAREALKLIDKAQDMLADEIAARKGEIDSKPPEQKKYHFEIL